MLAKQLQGSALATQPVFIEDTFSTHLYTGNGSTQTITNGIDLAGEGGMVWIKSRSAATNNFLFDTARGTTDELNSNTTDAEASLANSLTAFNADGFSIGSATGIGVNAATYASWTFRKQAKFFDVVTYTGNSANSRDVTHNLGSTPGFIIVKPYSGINGGWYCWHRSFGNTDYIQLDATAAKGTANVAFGGSTNKAPTSTTFTIGNDNVVNGSGISYVAYLFAHDAGGFGAAGTDNVISCGSYTGNGSTQTVSLGYEPQFLMYKQATGTGGDWMMFDIMRGLDMSTSDKALFPNSSSAESGGDAFNPTATGFVVQNNAAWNASGQTYIYIAIRRGPMKTPTSGTSVFTPTVYTGTNVDNRLVDTTIAPDMVWVRQRNDTVLGGMVVGDRLRAQPYLLTGTTAAEVNDADAFDAQIVSGTEYGTAFSAMNGFWCGNDATAKLNANTTSNNHIAEAFKRAPGFFDVVCYTGTGVTNRTVTHNLTTAPQLLFVKARNNVQNWSALCTLNSGLQGRLNTTDALSAPSAAVWGNGSSYVAPTSSVFTVGTDNETNASTWTYVAYLFATVAGVSKVFSFTGNGSSQTINCGFTAGARLVLIKRTDSTGDWYIWDSSRGIVSGNDPHLSLNTTAAEVTTDDTIDPDNSGFIVNQVTATNVNVNNATYIGLAIA